jgi:carbonic anhydrase
MGDFKTLLAGYRRFRNDGWKRERERWSRLAEGQSPRVMVIACSDSRVDPSIIFDASPGEIFVVRNIANLVPPFETGGGRHGVSAALEFAVSVLEVDDILVLGHGQCGGVEAALSRRFDGASPGDGGFIAHWVDLLDDARDRVLASGVDEETARRALEKEAVRVSLTNLRTFPGIAERETAGRLRLRGGWFAVRHGELELLDEATGQFSPV